MNLDLLFAALQAMTNIIKDFGEHIYSLVEYLQLQTEYCLFEHAKTFDSESSWH